MPDSLAEIREGREKKMYCENCGKQIGNEIAVCPYCGYQVQKGNNETRNFDGQGMQYDVRQTYDTNQTYNVNQTYGAKQPYDGNPQYDKEQYGSNQKPVYKQWWFWVIIGLVILVTAVSVVFILRSKDKKENEKLQNSEMVSSETEQENESTDNTESKVEAQLTPKVTQPEVKIENNSGEEVTRPEEAAESGSTIVVPSSGDSATAQASADEYIFQESNSRYLTEEEVRSKSSEELRLARNEIFARHGRLFNDEELQAYFSSKSWYTGTVPAGSFNTNVFNDYEKKNLTLIEKIEDEKK